MDELTAHYNKFNEDKRLTRQARTGGVCHDHEVYP